MFGIAVSILVRLMLGLVCRTCVVLSAADDLGCVMVLFGVMTVVAIGIVGSVCGGVLLVVSVAMGKVMSMVMGKDSDTCIVQVLDG